ncbi:hypothetical protein QM012_000037 [Aureobasidium pullulans]|uniref:NADP-dependent oxidoreductase domain-containing protein n=1 Tax=Aureobasidium pullulans TaxID=5580 RepID=A0ABR0TUI0_AURPU
MSSLISRRLGRDGPTVQIPGYGAMTIGLSSESLENRFKVLDRAYELGCTFWDTADIYGDSEALIGQWLKRTGRRNDIFLATKFGITLVDGMMGSRNDETYIRECLAQSLRKLKTDTIDLYYCHRLDGITPIENVVKVMAELQSEGKIKYIGLSEVSSDSLRRACKVAKISAVQVEYSPFSLEIESPTTALLETCRELGVAVVAYSPLGRGFITGQYKSRSDLPEDDYRRHYPRFSEENFAKNLDLVHGFEAVGKKVMASPGQVCLAWLMAQGDDIIPIPGTRKIRYLEENIRSVEVHLDKNDLISIRESVNNAEVAGSRAPPGFDLGLFADSPLL